LGTFFINVSSIWGRGVGIQPHIQLIENVPLGQKISLKQMSEINFCIKNNSDLPHTFILSVKQPKQTFQGYKAIPDTSWVWFEKNTITLKPHQKKEIPLYFKIPKKEEYYNRHWEAGIVVSTKQKKGELFGLIMETRYQIETESKSDIKIKDLNKDLLDTLVLSSSVLEFSNLILGTTVQAQVKLYNNTSKEHFYRVKTISPWRIPQGEFIPHSQGFEWLHQDRYHKWAKCFAQGKCLEETLSELKIKGKESQTITLKIYLPKTKEFIDKKLECLIFVHSIDEGNDTFSRIKIKSAAEKKNE
jgi:hypothetical protein